MARAKWVEVILLQPLVFVLRLWGCGPGSFLGLGLDIFFLFFVLLFFLFERGFTDLVGLMSLLISRVGVSWIGMASCSHIETKMLTKIN